MDNKNPKWDPLNVSLNYPTDSIMRNFGAYLILIGGCIALAIWVSPWFWIVAAVVVSLSIANVAIRGRARTRP